MLVRGADNVKPTTATYRLRRVAPERLAGWHAGPEQHPIDLSANREGSLLDTSEEEMDRGKTQITQRVAMFVVATLTLSTTLNAQRPLDRTNGFVLGIHTMPYVTGSFGRRALAAHVTDDFNGEYDMSGRSS